MSNRLRDRKILEWVEFNRGMTTYVPNFNKLGECMNRLHISHQVYKARRVRELKEFYKQVGAYT